MKAFALAVGLLFAPAITLSLIAGQAAPGPLAEVGHTDHTITITDCNRVDDAVLAVAISHTWRSDIVATLSDPTSAVTVLLWSNLGGRGDDLLLTIGDDAPEIASTQACNDDTPNGCEGFYRPELSWRDDWQAFEYGSNAVTMGAFSGMQGNGDWLLRIIDVAPADVGYLNAASLSLTCFVPDPTYTAWLPLAVRTY